MKHLVFHLRNPSDGRIDRVVVSEGVTLRDTSDRRYRPFLPVGAVVSVELVDDEDATQSDRSPVPVTGVTDVDA